MALVASLALIWFVFLPMQPNVEPATLRFAVVFHTIAAAFVLAIAEGFRSAARGAVSMRETHARELEHRTKNNFAMVSAVLGLQRARSETPAVREALGEAIGRVESIARAHAMLHWGSGATPKVDVGGYLDDLCNNLKNGLLADQTIALECRSETALMESERAIAIGLIVNELVTNAVRHAFPEEAPGRILVSFEREGSGWSLRVSDNGKGMASAKPGAGRRLVEAMVRELRATHTMGSGPGTVHLFAFAH